MTNRIAVVQGYITKLTVGAIANAANSSLLADGAVDAMIDRAVAPELAIECQHLHGCKTVQAETHRISLERRYERIAETVHHES